jgi:hypothetical protein
MLPNFLTLDVLHIPDLGWEHIRTNVMLIELSVRNTDGLLFNPYPIDVEN